MDASRNIPMLVDYEPPALYILSLEAPHLDTCSLLLILILSFGTGYTFNGRNTSHGIKVTACAKPAASNTTIAFIEPFISPLAEDKTAVSYPITAFSDPIRCVCSIDPHCPALCQWPPSPSRWHTPNEHVRRAGEASVGAIWCRPHF